MLNDIENSLVLIISTTADPAVAPIVNKYSIKNHRNILGMFLHHLNVPPNYRDLLLYVIHEKDTPSASPLTLVATNPYFFRL